MDNLSANPTVEEVQDEIVYQNVLIATLDPSDETYGERLKELESEISQLETLLESLASNGSQAASSAHSSYNSPASVQQTNDNSMGQSMSQPSSAKRPPPSSFLDAQEHPSKRPTPETSRSATPSLMQQRRNNIREAEEAARRRHAAAEENLRRQYEARQRDAELALRMSGRGEGSLIASSSQPAGVQLTLNHKGGFQRPPPRPQQPQPSPIPQHIKQERHGPTPSSSQNTVNPAHLWQPPSIPGPPYHQVKQEPQQISRPLGPPTFVDLTGSDSDEEPSAFATPARPPFAPPLPSSHRSQLLARNAAHQTLPHRHNMPSVGSPSLVSPSPSAMPGSWPTTQSQPRPQPFQAIAGQRHPSTPIILSQNNNGSTVYGFPSHQAAAQTVYSQQPGLSRHIPQTTYNPAAYRGMTSNAGYGRNSLNPWNIDEDDYDEDEDDDGVMITGSRQFGGYMPGAYPGYAGNEDLYRDRYDAFAAYDSTKSKEEIQALLANIRPDEDMPAHLRAQTPEAMTIRLHKYQELGLTWLQQCEDGTNKGGILADDMGLGKTVQMLALIVTRKSSDPRCKTTLIIAPVALMRQWEQEIRQKIKPGRHALTVFTHHGTSKAKSFSQLQHFDIVLTTYGSIASELKKKEILARNRARNPAIPATSEKFVILAEDAKWYRVILDEAQCIKNRKTQTSKGACYLQATYRFCVTGTPMMNNVEELYSLIRFLGIKPYCQWEKFRMDFKTNISSHYEEARDRGMQMLQALCKAIMLRRTKKSTFEGKPILVLPDRSTTVDKPEFDEDERAFYDSVQSHTQLQFNKYLRAGTVSKSYSAILVLLLRLRQACCHPHLIKDFGVNAASDLTDDQLVEFAKQLDEAVVNRIKSANGVFECPVCYDVTQNPAIFVPCGHDTCSECFSRIADAANSARDADDGSSRVRCPNCRANVDPKRLTDYTSFKRVYMPESLNEAELAVLGIVDESDEDDSDDDSDSTAGDSDAGSEGESLDGFIVNDDVEEDEDNEDSGVKAENADESDDSDDPDDLDLPFKKERVDKSGPVVKDEPGTSSSLVKEDPASADQVKEEPAVVGREVEQEAVVAGPSNLLQTTLKMEGKKKEKQKSKSSKKSKKSAKGECEDDNDEEYEENKKPIDKGKGKEKKKDKKKKKKKVKAAVTLAELKKLASRSATAKKAYLRKIRKTWVSSAKIDKTMEILKDIMVEPDGEKVLIFSQWTSLLDLLEIPIDEAGYPYRRYDGSMNAKQRGDAVDDFRDPRKGVRIMLVSLKAGNAGLNLNMASQVVILDPFWNPYIEEQAIDRAHRIGQTRPVTVHRVLIENTVEDRIIELQEKKRELISEALDEKSHSAIARLGVQELAYLFGVTNSLSQRVT